MKSAEYRQIIRSITRSVLRRKVPGLKNGVRIEIEVEIAKNIHARMYGANVDGVESPLWRDIIESGKPVETAQQILEKEM